MRVEVIVNDLVTKWSKCEGIKTIERLGGKVSVERDFCPVEVGP
ncbi:hypothetical protein GCM10007881_26560 [Mesorhizobium huakuii]|nr:hypothetical protein GCM10007881_26560 [Mesorhizobium huakuii]